jgi:hypothetical protein
MSDTRPTTIMIDGIEYPVPTVDTYTLAEARLFKQIGRISLLELEPRLATGDQDALICLIMITKARAGEPMTEEEVAELKISQVEVIWPTTPEQDDDAGPPADAAPSAEAPEAEPPNSETTRDDSGAQ